MQDRKHDVGYPFARGFGLDCDLDELLANLRPGSYNHTNIEVDGGGGGVGEEGDKWSRVKSLLAEEVEEYEWRAGAWDRSDVGSRELDDSPSADKVGDDKEMCGMFEMGGDASGDEKFSLHGSKRRRGEDDSRIELYRRDDGDDDEGEWNPEQANEKSFIEGSDKAWRTGGVDGITGNQGNRLVNDDMGVDLPGISDFDLFTDSHYHYPTTSTLQPSEPISQMECMFSLSSTSPQVPAPGPIPVLGQSVVIDSGLLAGASGMDLSPMGVSLLSIARIQTLLRNTMLSPPQPCTVRYFNNEKLLSIQVVFESSYFSFSICTVLEYVL